MGPRSRPAKDAGGHTGQKERTGHAKRAPHDARDKREARGDDGARDGLLYGRHPIDELLRQGGAIHRLWLAEAHVRAGGAWEQLARTASARGAEVRTADAARLHALVGDVVHQGAVAEVAPFAYAALEDLLPTASGPAPETPPLLLVLDQIQDPHNLGALTRSAAALGATGVVIGKDRSATMTPTAIKASAGAAYHVPVAQVVNLARALQTMRDRGLWTVGLDLAGEDRLAKVELRGPVALVIGAEGAGLRPLVARSCDYRVKLPLVRIGSLNASVAGAIALYEVARARASFPAAKGQTSP